MQTLLVANRGEIARRILRTAHAMGLRTVAVYAEADLRAPHAIEADRAILVTSYLDVDSIIAAARRTGADAVHPGYGFGSERAPFARAVIDAGLCWVGPPPDVISALGDKVRAKELMGAAGVPLLPGGALGVDSRSWAAAADAVGYPLLVKAAAGGGGRGMRVVTDPSDLAPSVEGAAREAAAAFGDGTVFIERWVPAPRHVEVQIMADTHDRVVHLGERECSIQRRHQKLIEESPSPGISPDLRDRLTSAAVAGAVAVGYVGAGTWEFLVDGEDFFFLEVNTRLQVEHPVTEAVTGLDLVRLQLQVAMGAPLGLDQRDITFSGHAIEVRVVAEDPAAGWMPSTGTLLRFEPTEPGARYDLGVGPGSVVTPDYDSLIGKVIAHAPTRPEAAASLARALDGLEVHGLTTDREAMTAVLREPDFLAGRTTTRYLEDHPAVLVPASPPALHLVAAALWVQRQHRRAARVLTTLPSGFRNLRSQDQRVAFRTGEADMEVEYTVDGDRWRATVVGRTGAGETGAAYEGRVAELGDDVVDIEAGGARLRCRVYGTPTSMLVVSALGQTAVGATPRFVDAAAALATGRGPTAPVPGTIVRVEVAVGDTVVAGQTLVLLEAMKLEHRIPAERDGVIAEIPVAAGDKVDAHQVLVVFE